MDSPVAPVGRSVSHPAAPAVTLDDLKRIAAALEDARRYMDLEVVEYFRERIATCAASDGASGPKGVLPVALGIVGAIESSSRHVKASVRGQLLAIGQSNGIAIYDAASGNQVHPLKPTPGAVPDLAFGPNGRLFSAGASDPALKVWDVAGQEPIDEIRHYCNPNAAAAVSPDGRLIASAGPVETEYTVQLWDAQTGAVWKLLRGHRGHVWTVASRIEKTTEKQRKARWSRILTKSPKRSTPTRMPRKRRRSS